MEAKLADLEKQYLKDISEVSSLADLDKLFLKAFGKNGQITLLPKKFAQSPQDQLRVIGPLFNKVKSAIEQAIEIKRYEVREASYQKLDQEKADFSTTDIKKRQGHLHPITQFEAEIAKLFGNLGFQQFDAPHIDTDFNNFEVLNIPEEHPARDLWDTLYLDYQESKISPGKLLLRTHTSNSQVRIMKENDLPIRMMNIGRCFRYENVDARHEHTFDQFELIYIDKGVSMAQLQYLSEYFMKAVFGPEVKVRLRPKYYPFVEPGAGVDGLCMACMGKGCKICGGVGWLELAGAGMIHPTVLKNGGIDPNIYSGIAWGIGPERMLMIKKQINDLRVFRSGDLKFLEEYESQ